MTDIRIVEDTKVKKYLESYKRLFFRNQLENPKSKLILDKKRESLGLSKEQVYEAEKILYKHLNDSIDFIKAIIDLNESNSVSENDLEIREYCEDLGLEESDIRYCLEIASEDELSNETKEELLESDSVDDLSESLDMISLDDTEKKPEKEVIEDKSMISEKKLEGEEKLSNNEVSVDSTQKKKPKKKKSKQNVKATDDKDKLPSFKQRAKEILAIDGEELEEDGQTISDNTSQFDSSSVKMVEISKEVDGNIEESVEAYFNDQHATEDIKVVGEPVEFNDDRFFNDFDENIEIKEETKEEIKESTSFIRYDGEDMLSETNTLDDILDLNSRDFKLETLKTLFYNGCILCVERFKNNIFDMRGRRNFTKDNIKDAFYGGYEELIDYTHAFLAKEGINDGSIDKEKLFERIFGLQCLDTLAKQINKINIMVDNSVAESQIISSIDRSIGIYKANSDKPHFKTFAVKSITRDIKSIFDNAKMEYNLRDSIEQGILKLILEAVEFINKCGLANFDIYTEDNGRTLNQLLESKAKAREVLGKYEENRAISDSEYMDILKDTLVEYPFFEDTYVALAKVEPSHTKRYNLLYSAIELLNKCGEDATNVIEELKNVEIELYIDEIKKIPLDAAMQVKKELCSEAIDTYHVGDFDTIFNTEIDHFGEIISDIDVNAVSEETRVSAFKAELRILKDKKFSREDKKEKILEYKAKYYVRDWECFKAEYAIFGRSEEGQVFIDLDRQDRLTILDYCMKSIREVSQSGKEKRILLSELQSRNVIEKRVFRDIEKEVFGFVIPLNEEEIKEFDFMEKINYIYRDSDDSIKALDIDIKTKKWDIKVPGFYHLIRDMQAEYEPIIMVYTEDDKTGKNKEGFVLTDRAIYSSYAKRFLKLDEIESLRIKNYSKIKNGERIFYDGIFVDVNNKDHKLCSNYMGSKDEFANVLNKVIDAYREVYSLPKLERFENKAEDNMLLGIDSENILFGNKKLQEELKVNLEDNKYYELMSDLLNYDNLSFREVLGELSKLVSKDLSEKIYFNEITEGSGEKIREACSSYVMSISELEEIYLLIDNTKKFPLQFQKLGIVITSKGIYCKNKMEDPWIMDLKYATNIKVKDENKIQITNRVIEFAHIKKKEDIYDLRDLIEFVVVLRRIMDNPLEEIEEELGNLTTSPAEKYTLDLVNSIKSENLRKLLYIHSEGVASEKKYAAAIESYADLDDVENPILLLDTTVFGVKTSGLLLTNKHIYYKEGMANGLTINLLAVSRVYMKNEKFYINGIEFKLASLNANDKTELCEKLGKLIKYLKETGFRRV